MTVSGVQQVMLHVKLMEVSRTKLRRLGFDWAVLNGETRVMSSAAGMLTGVTPAGTPTVQNGILVPGGAPSYASSGNNFAFGIVNGTSAFFGVLNAMRQDNLMKLRAEPHLVTISGRPASFNAGGEIPVPVPQSLGTISIEWKKYGAQVDFVPIVLGNGKIRLEVRPYVSELDDSRGYASTTGGTTIPGIRSRQAETAVEMTAGQTMAIAGLLYSREESENRGLPWVSEVPYFGVPFRKVNNVTNEIELLILVTPELVDAMDAHEVPQCGPGMATTTPNDWELFMKGHLEVPNCGPGGCGSKGGDCATPPPDGMIGPEEIQPLQAPGAMTPTNRPNLHANTANRVAQRQPAPNAQNRYNSSKANRVTADSRSGDMNSPPPFVGPVGYDVIK
jgi:pilus assembly protein CpaC